MRHNPAAGAISIMLRSLKMHGMAQAIGELTEQGSPAFEAALPILSQLLKAETADREVRSTAYQLKAARFPNYRDLAGFDFASSEVNEALARQLHRCEFLEDAHNVVLVGGPGTGKTHLATAIGVQCSATIWMGRQRQSGWPFWRSRRGDDCRGATITQALFCREMI
jgi:DNA replication protein DnaC